VVTVAGAKRASSFAANFGEAQMRRRVKPTAQRIEAHETAEQLEIREELTLATHRLFMCWTYPDEEARAADHNVSIDPPRIMAYANRVGMAVTWATPKRMTHPIGRRGHVLALRRTVQGWEASVLRGDYVLATRQDPVPLSAVMAAARGAWLLCR
jgi:hypothetical protein